MYAAFFGLTEPPFSIAPDPRYLYMSDRHSEAQAHLLYGLEHGSGFVQLTGEVGTGKTTLCRSVLAALPETIEVALILNPRINEHELLQTLCDELRISYAPGLSPKQLVDRLNHHLLQIHAEGRRTVLIIDEAQNLSREVLEQIRLLTNLETNKEKLLQIILIGQPELVELLARPDLRQLAQRVTARYHLLPLSRRETAAFVNHRLFVAGCERPVFNRGASKQIYRFSRGIPRLINLICDRALLGAYSQDKRIVGAGIIKKAAREVLGRNGRGRLWWIRPAWWFGLVVAGLLLPVQFHFSDSVSSLFNRPRIEDVSVSVKNLAPENVEPITSLKTEKPVTESITEVNGPIAVKLLTDLPLNSYADAMTAAVSLWRDNDETINDCAAVSSVGLQCYYRQDGLIGLSRYNRPSVLTLRNGKSINYPLLIELNEENAILEISGQKYSIAWSAIEAQWDGRFILLWRPPPAVLSTANSRNDSTWLRRAILLWSLQTQGTLLSKLSDSGKDDQLREDIQEFQRWYGIEPTGVVDVDTLIQMNTVLAGHHLPTLINTGSRG